MCPEFVKDAAAVWPMTRFCVKPRSIPAWADTFCGPLALAIAVMFTEPEFVIDADPAVPFVRCSLTPVLIDACALAVVPLPLATALALIEIVPELVSAADALVPAAAGAETGLWETAPRKLPPGEYAYKFLIDGWRWLDDPGNPRKIHDGNGGLNSVLVVP